MIKHHQEQMKGRNETQDKLKKETIEASNELTASLVIKKLIKFLKTFVSDTLNMARAFKVSLCCMQISSMSDTL